MEWDQDSLGAEAILFQGTKQNPPSSEGWIIIIIVIARFRAMVGKVFVAKTQVHGTQWESDVLAWVDDATTFLNIMTKWMHQRCSSGGAVFDLTNLALLGTTVCWQD